MPAPNILEINIKQPPGTPPRPPGGGGVPPQPPGPPPRPPGGGGGSLFGDDDPPWLRSLRDTLERLTKNQLTYDEAMKRAEALASRHGQSITDYGRDKGLLGINNTALDFARQNVYAYGKKAGLDVQEPLPEALQELIDRETRRHYGEQKRFAGEAESRDAERQDVADTLAKDKKDAEDDLQKRMREAVDRHNAEQKRFEKEAKSRDAERQDVADTLAKERAKKAAEAEKAAETVKDAEAARMAKMRTIAGAAQTMGSGGGGIVSGGLQMASTGAFGEAAAAFAGGPIGIALAAAPIILGQLNKGLDTLHNSAIEAGKSLAGEQRFNFSGAVKKTTDTLEEIPIVGQAMAISIKQSTFALRLMEQTAQAFIQRGAELKGYSGPLSSAFAAKQVADIQSDIKEAQRIGPAVAEMVKVQSDLDVAVKDITLELKASVADGLAEILVEVRDVAIELKPFIKEAMKPLALIVRSMAAIAAFPWRLIARILRGVNIVLERFIGKDEPAKPVNNDLLDQVFQAAREPLSPIIQDDPAAGARPGGRVGIPRR